MRKSVEIRYLFSRNFAQIEVLRENAREFVRAKISTNKVHSNWLVYMDFAKLSILCHTRNYYSWKWNELEFEEKVGAIIPFFSYTKSCAAKRSSSWSNVISGVPHGSILGPLLFLIYVNDIPDICISISKLFVDDTKLYQEIHDLWGGLF